MLLFLVVEVWRVGYLLSGSGGRAALAPFDRVVVALAVTWVVRGGAWDAWLLFTPWLVSSCALSGVLCGSLGRRVVSVGGSIY